MAREASCSRKLCGVCAADLTDALIGGAPKHAPMGHPWLWHSVDSVSNPPCSRAQPLWWIFFGAKRPLIAQPYRKATAHGHMDRIGSFLAGRGLRDSPVE